MLRFIKFSRFASFSLLLFRVRFATLQGDESLVFVVRPRDAVDEVTMGVDLDASVTILHLIFKRFKEAFTVRFL